MLPPVFSPRGCANTVRGRPEVQGKPCPTSRGTVACAEGAAKAWPGLGPAEPLIISRLSFVITLHTEVSSL